MGSRGTKSTVSSPTPDFSSVGDLKSSDIVRLRREMGQTGYEAGDPDAMPRDKIYAHTGKAYVINKYLMTDGESYYVEGEPWSRLVDEPWIERAIRRIDSGMQPLPEDIRVTRFVDSNALGSMLGMPGIDARDMIRTLIKDPSAGKAFSETLRNVDYVHKGYSSTSYVNSHVAFGTRDVVLNMVMRSGTRAIITRNIEEHEIVGDRNLRYNFTGDYRIQKSPEGRDQLVLDVYV